MINIFTMCPHGLATILLMLGFSVLGVVLWETLRGVFVQEIPPPKELDWKQVGLDFYTVEHKTYTFRIYRNNNVVTSGSWIWSMSKGGFLMQSGVLYASKDEARCSCEKYIHENIHKYIQEGL